MSTRPAQLVACHCMPLEFVKPIELFRQSTMIGDPIKAGAYNWLERQTGFYPFFLAYGDEDAHVETGYGDQWRKLIAEVIFPDGTTVKTYHEKGKYPNDVLFLFRCGDFPDCVHIDTDAWETCLMRLVGGRGEPSKAGLRRLFRRSWSTKQWARFAATSPRAVQLLVPGLDLRKAFQVWTRNKSTAQYLELLGFSGVVAKRVPCIKD